MSDLGGGIALNEYWDFEVSQTGDILATTGLAELQKDVAFNVARNVEEFIGRPAQNNTQKKIQIAVQDVLVDEPRVDAIIQVNVRQIDRTANAYEVIANVETEVGPFELVFEVGQ